MGKEVLIEVHLLRKLMDGFDEVDSGVWDNRSLDNLHYSLCDISAELKRRKLYASKTTDATEARS